MKSSRKKELPVRNDDQIRNRDFPWLWTVRSYWIPGLNNVRVKNVDNDEYFQKVLGISQGTSMSNGEIWVRHGLSNRKRGFELIKVEKVNIPIEAGDGCPAIWIARTAPPDCKILNIVSILNPLKKDETIVVFRLKRGDFGDILSHAIHEYSRRTRNAAA
ncbi:hypothetical protein D4R51_00440 [bacterium]|nr:MAG: hypothetical protein D4R51_00440 [bacterium]